MSATRISGFVATDFSTGLKFISGLATGREGTGIDGTRKEVVAAEADEETGEIGVAGILKVGAAVGLTAVRDGVEEGNSGETVDDEIPSALTADPSSLSVLFLNQIPMENLPLTRIKASAPHFFALRI